jgi:hypothetical protein
MSAFDGFCYGFGLAIASAVNWVIYRRLLAKLRD